MAIRRRDLSAYLVHLTRDYEGNPARANLLSILGAQTIEARNPYGIAIARLKAHGCDTGEALESQKVVCFSETPLDDLSGLIDPGVWRHFNFQPYGLVFARDKMLLDGANPVWYLNSYSGPGVTFRWLAHAINNEIESAAVAADGSSDPASFLASEIARLTPFIETMGSWRTDWGRKEKDFSFEREWRHNASFEFDLDDVVAVVTPPDDEADFRQELATGVDAEFAAHVGWRPLEPDEVLDSLLVSD